MKRWVTGEEAEMEEEDIEDEMFTLARDFMSASLLRKLPGHKSKETDHYLWKQYRCYTTRKGVQIRLLRCPMRHRCGCKAGIRIMEGTGFKQLDRIGEHNADSHKQDKSKYLKHEQIVAVADAVTIAPQQSAVQLRRNMSMAGPSSPAKMISPDLMRSVQRRVSASRAQLTMRKMEGRSIDTTYGSLTQLASVMWFRTLIDRNNDPDDDFHFNLFKPVVIGRDIKAENDILHLNVTSPWFLFNALRAIATGWVFQLNGDATFNFCKTAVDMIGFGVNSLGKHNHPLCWSLVPHNSEGELTYTGTFQELQEAVMLVFDIESCSDPDCEFCAHLDFLMHSEGVIKFKSGDAFKNGKLPVDTAQCDNILGFGNFTREIFDMDANVCKCHALGKYLFSVCLVKT